MLNIQKYLLIIFDVREGKDIGVVRLGKYKAYMLLDFPVHPSDTDCCKKA